MREDFARRSARAVLLLCLVAGGGPSSLAARAQPGAGGAQGPLPVEVAAVRVGPLRVEVAAVGSLSADEYVVLRPEVEGRVQTLRFQEGERVRKGDPLVMLDPAEFQAQVAASEAAARLWRLKFERARDLLARKVISQQEYDEVRAALEEAEARLALDRVRLEKTTLRAPFDGVVGLREVSPGDYVQKGQNLVGLSAVDPLKVDFAIPERYAAQARVGQRFAVTVESLRDAQFEGEVYAVDAQLEASTRMLRLRGRLPNPQGVLRPGMFARVRLELAEKARALWVPEQALVPLGHEQHVYRLREGRALLTRIETGARRAGEVEVLGGLDPADQVVTAGQLRLHDGAAVVVVGAFGAGPTVQR